MDGRARISSPRGLLTPLQRRVLSLVGSRTTAFFLTGGSALAEYHLGHRRSQDLDLFTTREDAFDDADRIIRDVASEMSASATAVRSGIGFRRYLIESGEEQAVVDLVLESAEQIDELKLETDAVLVDTLREIAVNKLCALLSRTETKDLVDLFFISKAGVEPLELLPEARRKDGGMSPGMLAYTISQVPVRPLPDGMVAALTPEELDAFKQSTIAHLQKKAFPGNR